MPFLRTPQTFEARKVSKATIWTWTAAELGNRYHVALLPDLLELLFAQSLRLNQCLHCPEREFAVRRWELLSIQPADDAKITMNQVSNWYAKIHGLDMRLPGGFEEMTLRIILDANATAYLLAGSSKYIRLWYLFASFSTEFHFRSSQLSKGDRLHNFINKGNDLSLGLQIR